MHNMAIAEKFMFDTRFDEIDGLSLNNQENGMSNSLLQDENSKSNNDSKIEKELEEEKRIAQIHEEYYQTGKNDGVAEALIGIEANISKTLSIISDKINDLDIKQNLVNQEISDNLVILTQTIIKKIFPTLDKNLVVDEITKVIIDLPKLYTEEPEILIKINPLIIDQLNSRLSKEILDKTQLQKLKLIEDAAVRESDCQIEWSSGFAERNLDKLMQKVEDIIAQNINSASYKSHDNDERKPLSNSNKINDETNVAEDENEEINNEIIESNSETIIKSESDISDN